jgi:hypothetical protein
MFHPRMQQITSPAIFRFCLFAAMAVSPGAWRCAAQAKPAESPAFSVPVLVSDFELNSAAAKPRGTAGQPAGEKPKPEVPLVYAESEAPSGQARQLIEYFSLTLVRTLERHGFRTARSSGRNPPAGAQIRGVFAEADALNRIRRAILGGGSPTARFLLYVGVFNLARPEQPLYLLADNQPESSEYGPVITLNNYVPLEKFEVDKNPTEEDVQKICNQIAAHLVTLLEANPQAFSH